METKRLTKKDLQKVFHGQLMIHGANNYERQRNVGFIQAIMPIIERVYGSDEDKRETHERHMKYFLANDITGAIPIGVAAAMEEMHANGPDTGPDAINAVRTALMRPLAGLRGSLLDDTARPIPTSLTISLVHVNLGWVGPIFFVIGMNIVSLDIHYLEVFQGYKQGIKLVKKISSSGLISRITGIAAIAAYTIVRDLISALIVMNIPIEIESGEIVVNIRKTLDGLMPGILGLAYTFLVYYPVAKEKKLGS